MKDTSQQQVNQNRSDTSSVGSEVAINNQTMEKAELNDPALTNQRQERPLRRDLFLLSRYWLSQRRVQLVLGALLLGLGAWFNWAWLVTAGLAPLILAIAPCAAMCLMGMCMHKGHGESGCHGVGDDDKTGNSSDRDS